MEEQDFILCECELEPLRDFVASIEENFEVIIAKAPSTCMTMIQAEDSVEFQDFYLGEALTTECEVIVNGQRGYGICLGDEPVRSYCIAFIDALTQLPGADLKDVEALLTEQHQLIRKAEQLEYNQIMRTRVDFKLMEQE
ncbi:phosphonate C-P lyase system protein PhnG [Mucilaginibacter sp. cycad4]|uniref:phosphonate C-P lyase system protein PhnG n=1 Tax=Mucilaginibacter sp. cycad4 TaxID=3342096 RepID=UPI002AAC10F2|nr:phosphonate C-P lyase system protein PhnG [Mucilaginibacter gossypii]WPV00760.1 phosphonate C-P lyase system protein PhnG [Mucilaginibacter gossypii]